MSKRISTIMLAVLAAASLLAAPASAHPTLKSASPPAEGAVTSAPTEIRLGFSEGIILKFSGVELKDEAGKKITTGAAKTDPKDQKQLVVPLQTPLPAGTYTVVWHIVSADTHRVNGTYTFKVER